MLRVVGGRTHYGEAVGIMTLETVFPRIPGDVGNASTFRFPVKLRTVKGASINRVVKQGDPALLEPFIEAAKELEKEGVRAITTSCGFLALFQDELAKSVKIPVFASSLMQVPLVYKMLGKGHKVGIITADSGSLSEKHLRAAGIDSIPLAIAGMEDQEEFPKAFLRNEPAIDPDKIRAEIVGVVKNLVSKNPDIGAFVLECANMPPYSAAIQEATGLPVFDIVTFINYVYGAVVRKPFKESFM